MNRILQGYLGQLNRAADRIDAAAEGLRAEISKLKTDKEEMTQKYWARGKKAAVLAETSTAYEALQAENADLKDKLRQSREFASRLRVLARALKEGLEP